MTTKQKNTMYQQIEEHGNNLKAIFNTDLPPVELCKKLYRLEKQANKVALDWCNGDIDNEQSDKLAAKIVDKVYAVLGSKKAPIKFNGDARGYALKMPSEFIRANDIKIHTDWGGYGIIAPDFTPNN